MRKGEAIELWSREGAPERRTNSHFCEAKVFLVVNSRHHAQETEHSGIGLNNIKKRLNLLFGEEYTLSIDDTDKDIYLVELVIPITK